MKTTKIAYYLAIAYIILAVCMFLFGFISTVLVYL